MIMPLTKHLNIVQGPHNAQYPYCNCLYINDERKALIDTGCGQKDLDHLKSQHIDVVINSHFHEDHILNNRFFSGAEIWAHALDAPAIRSTEVFMSYYGFRDPKELSIYIDFLGSINIQSSPVHKELQDSDLLDFGEVKLSVIFAPGHSPGHCCFFEEKEGILFSSDINLNTFGPWYCQACSNLDDFITSIRKCMLLRPRIMVTSHNGIIADSFPSRFLDYLDIIFRTEDKIRTALADRPSTLEDLEKRHVYYGADRKEKVPLASILDRMAVEQHLDRLKRLGEVKQDGLLYYLS